MAATTANTPPANWPRLGQAAGFETVSLKTIDVYDRKIDPRTAELLVDRGDDLVLSAAKRSSTSPARRARATGLPERFYHGDPTRMSGALRRPRHESQRPASPASRSRTAPSAWWPVVGNGRHLPAGRMDRRGRRPAPPAPDAAASRPPLRPARDGEITLRLDAARHHRAGHPAPASLPGRCRRDDRLGPCAHPARCPVPQDAFLRVVRKHTAAPETAMSAARQASTGSRRSREAQTDIAHYTHRILPELAEASRPHRLDRCARLGPRARTISARCPPARPRPHPATRFRQVRATVQGPDAIFVHIGNSWAYHAGFLRLVRRIPVDHRAA